MYVYLSGTSLHSLAPTRSAVKSVALINSGAMPPDNAVVRSAVPLNSTATVTIAGGSGDADGSTPAGRLAVVLGVANAVNDCEKE